MTKENLGIIGCIIVFIIAAYVAYRIKNLLNTIVNDTLKTKEGKWSKTYMIMASAWFSVVIVFFADFFKNGLNQWAFSSMLGVAVGANLIKAYSNKVDPLVQPPTSTTTVEQEKTSTGDKTTLTEDKG